MSQLLQVTPNAHGVTLVFQQRYNLIIVNMTLSELDEIIQKLQNGKQEYIQLHPVETTQSKSL